MCLNFTPLEPEVGERKKNQMGVPGRRLSTTVSCIDVVQDAGSVHQPACLVKKKKVKSRIA